MRTSCEIGDAGEQIHLDVTALSPVKLRRFWSSILILMQCVPLELQALTPSQVVPRSRRIPLCATKRWDR